MVDCDICQELMVEPYVFNCGHSFCCSCTSRILTPCKPRCPLCRHSISSVSPNYSLGKLLKQDNYHRVFEITQISDVSDVSSETQSTQSSQEGYFCDDMDGYHMILNEFNLQEVCRELDAVAVATVITAAVTLLSTLFCTINYVMS